MIDASAIETERLLLAPLAAADAEELRRLTDDPRIVDAVSFLRSPFALADAQAMIASNGNGRDLFRGVRRRSDRVLIGVIGAHEDGTGAIEIGYWIGIAFQRQGCGFEAARGLVMQLAATHPAARIVAECRPENRASWRLLERLGFRATGAPGARPGRLVLALTAAGKQ